MITGTWQNDIREIKKKKTIDKITTDKYQKIDWKNVNRDMTKLIDKMLSETDKPNWQNVNRVTET